MRLLTGSALALLVAGVVFVNLRGSPEERTDPVAPPGSAHGAVGDANGSGATGDGARAVSHLDATRALDQVSEPGVAPEGPGRDLAALASAGVAATGERTHELSARPDAAESAAPTTQDERGAGEPTIADLLGVGERPARGGADAPAPRGALRGRVSDRSGAALAGVRVEVVRDCAAVPSAVMVADANGEFRADALELGTYAVRVDARTLPPGFLAPWYGELARTPAMPPGFGAPWVTVDTEGEAAVADLVLVRAGRARGRVFGRDGRPASDALVRVQAVGPGLAPCRAVAATDARGEFGLELVPGEYELEVAFRPDGPNAGAPRIRGQRLVVPEGEDVALPALRVPGTILVAEPTLPTLRTSPLDRGADGAVVALAGDEGAFFVSTEQDFFAPNDATVVDAVPGPDDEAAFFAPTEPVDTAPGEDTAAEGVTLQVGDTPGSDESQELAHGDGERELGASPRLVELELRGRVVSNFGEPLADVEVVATEGANGEVRAFTTTDEDGQYSLVGATGAALVVVARGERLLAPSSPLAVRAEEGQRRVRLPDLLVEVRRVYRLEGRIVVAEAELTSFGSELASRLGPDARLDRDAVLRTYLRGLRLEQRRVGSRNGRPVPIAEDGTFVWSCALPADDVEFVLEARGLRLGGRASKTTLVVTPAGDRTVTVTLPFPTHDGIEVTSDDGAPPLAPE